MIHYEVYAQVQFEYFDAYVEWLRTEHIPEMLQLPGFQGAELLLQKTGALMSSSREVKTIYWLETEASLKTYLSEHALTQRQKGVDKFPGQFSTQREIWLQSEKF